MVHGGERGRVQEDPQRWREGGRGGEDPPRWRDEPGRWRDRGRGVEEQISSSQVQYLYLKRSSSDLSLTIYDNAI